MDACVLARQSGQRRCSFVAKIYHGHRCVPASMDELVDALCQFKRHTAAVKLEKLVESADKRRKKESDSVSLTVDPSKVHPETFVGLKMKKNFDGFGIHEGKVLSHDHDFLGGY